MIPQTIHYCWFGKGLMPASQKAYIKHWAKIMPQYQIKCWDESNFDIDCNIFVKTAYQIKKYAFVSDYARLKALYTEGGFYLDTDVEVFQSFDTMKNHKFVSAIEYFVEFEQYRNLLDENFIPKDLSISIPYLGFLSAFIGSEPRNLLIKDMLQFYDGLTVGQLQYHDLVIDGLLAKEALKYGFKYSDSYQELEHGMVIYPSSMFCSMPNQVNDKSYLLHRCAQSWQPKTLNANLQLRLDKLNLLKLYKLFSRLKKHLMVYL